MSEQFKRGQRLSDIKASDLQKLANTSNDYNVRFTVSPPLKLLHAVGGGGMHLTWEANEGFWAQITYVNAGTGACGWIEVVPKSDGGFEPRLNGRKGDSASCPAYPIPQGPVPVGCYVYLLAGWQHTSADSDGITGQEYLFCPPIVTGFVQMGESSTEYYLFMGRTITDAVTTAGSTTITSASGNFQSSDEGSTVMGPGIPGREVNDGGVTQGSNVITSVSANFTSADIGQSVSGGTAIPSGTTIVSVQYPSEATMSAAATQTANPLIVQIGSSLTTISSVTNSTTAVLSQGATVSASNVSLTLATQSQVQAYRASIVMWNNGSWSGIADEPYTYVWFIPANNEAPLSSVRYFGQLVGYDAFGKPVWSAAFPAPYYSAIALMNSDGTWTTSTIGAYTVYSGHYFPSFGVVPDNPTQNCWLIVSNLGGNYGGTPFPNTAYFVEQYGVNSDGLPIFGTDMQGPYFPIKTPTTFTDHPSEWAISLDGFIQATKNVYQQVSPFILGQGWYAFGALPGTTGQPYTFPTAGNIYVGGGGGGSYSLYAGANGTDAAGSQFINGICVVVGTSGCGGSGADGGSSW